MQQISDFGRVVSEYDENKHILSKTKSINEKVDALCKAIEYLKQREEEYEEDEEEETPSITSRIIKSMKMPVIIVVAAHLAVIGGIMITSSNSAKAKQISSDKKALEESYSYASVEDKGENDWPKPKFHVVTSKDTFYGLVKKYKVDANKFKEINKIKDINVLIDGKKLIIP